MVSRRVRLYNRGQTTATTAEKSVIDRPVSQSGDKTKRVLDLRGGAIVAGAFACVYLVTSARHFLGGDAGEFATIAGAGGYAHPPGYPIYSLYLWVTSLAPFSSAAHEAAMATGLLGAMAVGLFYLAMRAWRLSRVAAGFGAILFGLAPEIWFLHTVPEAFALNHVVVAAILMFSAPGSPVTGGRRMAALGLAAALGIAHHHMIILMAPLGFYGVYRSLGESRTEAWKLLTLGGGCLLLGFLPYGYLVWVTTFAPEAYHWGEVESWGELLDAFLRRDYGTFGLTHGGNRVTALEQIRLLATEAGADLLYFPGLLAVAGIVVPAASVDGSRLEVGGVAETTAHLSLVGAWLLSGPFFVALIGRGISGSDYLHLRKFHAQFEMMTALFAAVGMGMLVTFISKRLLRRLILGATATACIMTALPYLDDHTGPTVEDYLWDTVAPLPEGAVLIGDSDHRYFGIEYLQRVEGHRRDIRYIDTRLLGFDWHRGAIESELDVESGAAPGETRVGVLIRNLHEAGHAVFVTHLFDPKLADHWKVYPVGTTYRVIPRDEQAPPLVDVYERNRKLLQSFRVEPRPRIPETSWNHLVLTHYALNWQAMAQQLERAGAERRAKDAREVQRLFAPWMSGVRNGG